MATDVRIELRPDGSVRVDVEDSLLEECDKSTETLEALLRLFGTGFEGVSHEPRKPPIPEAQPARVRGSNK